MNVYDREDLIRRFDAILEKTFGEIDNKGLFEKWKDTLQKGIAGSVIEQCVLGYEPDTRQEADLLVRSGEEYYQVELKTTGMVLRDSKFAAKEPMSITAVGIYDIAEQTFETSHFWNKLEYMLIVYYHYLLSGKVSAYDYRKFPVKGYEFHEFSEEDKEVLKRDWQTVHDLIENVVSHHLGEQNWKESVKEEYLKERTILRRVLNYIDLAPKYPPRFRLKQTVVSSMIAKHFGQSLEQLPGRYTFVSDIDKKCGELTEEYSGMTLGELADVFGVEKKTDKAFAERIVIKMFGGESKSLNQIELFHKFGIIAKTITLTPKGGRTEDMKLFHFDFDEMKGEFEDSAVYSYFADHEILCIICEEPRKEYITEGGKRKEVNHPLTENKFIGFKRVVFSDEFIEESVRRFWEDTRDKVINGKLKDVVRTDRHGKPIINKSGSVSSAPNFLKSRENKVFMRGSGENSSLENKTEEVNGIKMLPQYVWIKGKTVIEEMGNPSVTGKESMQ